MKKLRRLKTRIRSWWRKIRGRCVVCGKKLEGVPVWHPAYLGERSVCRGCSKMVVHARNFGMGEGRIIGGGGR